jgi:hypothetical protein
MTSGGLTKIPSTLANLFHPHFHLEHLGQWQDSVITMKMALPSNPDSPSIFPFELMTEIHVEYYHWSSVVLLWGKIHRMDAR